jgi:beta-galactosidase
MDGTGSVGKAFDVSAPLGLWSSVFEAKEAKAVGIIEGGLTPRKTFLTERQYGKGKIVMLGSLPIGEDGDAMLIKLLDHYAVEAGIRLRTDVTKGTIVAPRQGDGYTVWVIVNMDGSGGNVTVPQDGIDLVTQSKVFSGKLEIGSYEYRIIRFDEE